MTTRERLHAEIDQIPDEIVEEALRVIRSLAGSKAARRRDGRAFYGTATREQFAAALDRIAAGHESLPVLPPEAFERESLYEESL